MVSAWANNGGIVLGQIKVDEKSNEIMAIPGLLKLLEVENCIITIDAMGCQKDIAEKITKKDADYILALKGNHGILHDDVKFFLDDSIKNNFKNIKHDYYETFDKNHGRIEKRKYWITDEITWLDQKCEWSKLNAIGVVESSRTIGNETKTERRYYISSLPLDAKRFGNGIRGHWGIENSLHWVLDIAFREDECRKRKDNSAENFSMLRHIALNLLKQEKTLKRGIKGKRLKSGWDTDYLEKVLLGEEKI